MNRPHLIAVAGVLLAACGDNKAAPRASAPPPIAAPAAKIDSTADRVAAPEWVYSSTGKRDPFHSFIHDEPRDRPDTRCSTPLGRFEIDQLRLVAVVTGLDDPVAMVEAPNGVGYALRRGVCIGRNGGVIASVRGGEVVVSEWAIRADGSREKTQTVLRLPKEASLNLEE